MRAPGLVGAASVAVALAGLSWSGCAMCNDVGCESGAEVEIVTALEEPVPPATYVVHVEADDVVLRATCVVADTYADSHCVEELLEGDSDSVSSRIAPRSLQGPPVIEHPTETPRGGEVEEPALVHGFYIQVGEDDTHGSSIEHRGPDHLSIRIVRGDEEVFVDELEPDYHRVHHRGPERCGFCDHSSLELDWSPPPPG